jgi:hypothetical protein
VGHVMLGRVLLAGLHTQMQLLGWGGVGWGHVASSEPGSQLGLLLLAPGLLAAAVASQPAGAGSMVQHMPGPDPAPFCCMMTRNTWLYLSGSTTAGVMRWLHDG